MCVPGNFAHASTTSFRASIIASLINFLNYLSLHLSIIQISILFLYLTLEKHPSIISGTPEYPIYSSVPYTAEEILRGLLPFTVVSRNFNILTNVF